MRLRRNLEVFEGSDGFFRFLSSKCEGRSESVLEVPSCPKLNNDGAAATNRRLLLVRHSHLSTWLSANAESIASVYGGGLEASSSPIEWCINATLRSKQAEIWVANPSARRALNLKNSDESPQ
jgi:hypothetical protein